MWYSLYHTDLWGKDHSHGVARLNIGMHQIFSRLPFRNGRIIGSHTRKISINKKKYWGIINWHLKLRQTNTVFLGRGSANLSSGTLKVQQITKLPFHVLCFEILNTFFKQNWGNAMGVEPVKIWRDYKWKSINQSFKTPKV